MTLIGSNLPKSCCCDVEKCEVGDLGPCCTEIGVGTTCSLPVCGTQVGHYSIETPGIGVYNGYVTYPVYPTPGNGMPSQIFTPANCDGLVWGRWWNAWWNGINPTDGRLTVTGHITAIKRVVRVDCGAVGQTAQAPSTSLTCAGSGLAVIAGHAVTEDVMRVHYEINQTTRLKLIGTKAEQEYTCWDEPTAQAGLPEIFNGPTPEWLEDNSQDLWGVRGRYQVARWGDGGSIMIDRTPVVSLPAGCTAGINQVETRLQCPTTSSAAVEILADYPLVLLPQEITGIPTHPYNYAANDAVGATEAAWGIDLCIPDLYEQLVALDMPSFGDDGANDVWVGLVKENNMLRIMVAGNSRVSYGNVQKLGRGYTYSGTATYSPTPAAGDSYAESWVVEVEITATPYNWCLRPVSCPQCLHSYAENCATTINVGVEVHDSGVMNCASGYCGGGCGGAGLGGTAVFNGSMQYALHYMPANGFQILPKPWALGDSPFPWESQSAYIQGLIAPAYPLGPLRSAYSFRIDDPDQHFFVDTICHLQNECESPYGPAPCESYPYPGCGEVENPYIDRCCQMTNGGQFTCTISLASPYFYCGFAGVSVSGIGTWSDTGGCACQPICTNQGISYNISSGIIPVTDNVYAHCCPTGSLTATNGTQTIYIDWG